MIRGARVDVVDDVAAAFATLLGDRSFASIALSGGDTARACYERVAARAPDWSDVTVFFGDERWVEVSSPESNEGLARRTLLTVVGASHVQSVRDAGTDAVRAAARYDALVRDAGALDVVHLGLGDDGHTASLFPGSVALDEHDRLVVATGDDAHPYERVTFTYPAIARARLVVFTVAGRDKRAAFTRVVAGEDVPAARVRAHEVRWLVDRSVVSDESDTRVA